MGVGVGEGEGERGREGERGKGRETPFQVCQDKIKFLEQRTDSTYSEQILKVFFGFLKIIIIG